MSSLAKIDIQMNNILSFINRISKFENNNQKKSNSHLTLEDNQSDSITSENFPFSHICNRDVNHSHLLFNKKIFCIDS